MDGMVLVHRYDEKDGVDAAMLSKERASLRALSPRTYSPLTYPPVHPDDTQKYYNRWPTTSNREALPRSCTPRPKKKMEEMQITSDLTWIEYSS